MIMSLIKDIAKRVFKQLKSGHTERVYQNAFEIELRNHNIAYETEKKVLYTYLDTKGKEYVVGDGRIDLFIKDDNEPIIVELKATSDLHFKENQKSQLKKYMRYLNKENVSGLLINFPQPSSANKKTLNVVCMNSCRFYECDPMTFDNDSN